MRYSSSTLLFLRMRVFEPKGKGVSDLDILLHKPIHPCPVKSIPPHVGNRISSS